MGKQQKLKEMRREMRMQESSMRPKGPTILSYAVAGLTVVGIGILVWKLGFEKAPQSSPALSASVSASPDAMPPFTPMASHTVVMETSKGNVTLDLYREVAPKTVDNFVKLAKEDFYNGTKFHRVMPEFMVQGGDPNTKGSDPSSYGRGGPSYAFEDEINPRSLGLSEEAIQSFVSQGYTYNYDLRSLPVDSGYIAMANSGPDTNGSQFFIVTYEPQKHLYGKHTVFGKVTEGMDVVRNIRQGDELKKVTVK